MSWDPGTSQEAESGGPWLGELKRSSYFAAVAVALRGKGLSKVTQPTTAQHQMPPPLPRAPGSLALLYPGPLLPEAGA